MVSVMAIESEGFGSSVEEISIVAGQRVSTVLLYRGLMPLRFQKND